MNETLQNKLFEKYPEFFKGHKLSKRESCLAFGIQCDDGWYNIIDSACSVIKPHCEREKITSFEFQQIKEKFGTLRIYYQGSDRYIDGVLDLAETISYRTCEVTGKPGRICCTANKGWVKTLCEEKMQELGYQIYDSKSIN